MKLIHRIYFGFDGKPDPYLRFLETWQKELPDFEIVHWNADNLPLDLNEYTRRMYVLKNHAFLSDYFRWWILNEYGGVYLDADIEVINGAKFSEIVNSVQENPDLDGFIGIDNKDGGWYTAHSMGAKKGSFFSSEMLRIYDSLGPFVPWMDRNVYLFAPCLVGLFFANNNHNVGAMGSTSHLDVPRDVIGVRIYPQEYFSPITPVVRDGVGAFIVNGLSAHTCLCHHFSGSWHDSNSIYAKVLNEKKKNGQLLLKEVLENGLLEQSNEAIESPTIMRVMRLLRRRIPQAVQEFKQTIARKES